jgi:polysaccharide biosynthesis protein PslH
MSPRRVLYVTNQLPYPPWSGGQRREYEVIRRLSADYEIHLMAIGRLARYSQVSVNAAVAATGVASVTVVPSSSASPHLPPRMREHYSPFARRMIGSMLRQVKFDLVHIEGFFHMQSLPEELVEPVVLLEENIEFDLQRQYEAVTGNPHQLDWRACRDYEIAAWRQAAAIGVVSEEDLARVNAVRLSRPGIVVPLGADHILASGSPPPRLARDTVNIGFLGNFRWLPSEDAARYLICNVWSALLSAVPHARLTLIGAGASKELRSLIADTPQTMLAENVENVSPHLWTLDMFCCPLRVGGGIKIKIYEALAAGCAIVSTPQGAQGLAEAVRDALVVVDPVDRLAGRMADLIGDPGRLRALYHRSLHASTLLPTWDTATAWQRSLWETAVAGQPPNDDHIDTYGGDQ